MNTSLTYNTQVADDVTGLEGRLLGPFVRQGEKWWTVYWQDDTTTSLREKDILGG